MRRIEALGWLTPSTRYLGEDGVVGPEWEGTTHIGNQRSCDLSECPTGR